MQQENKYFAEHPHRIQDATMLYTQDQLYMAEHPHRIHDATLPMTADSELRIYQTEHPHKIHDAMDNDEMIQMNRSELKAY